MKSQTRPPRASVQHRLVAAVAAVLFLGVSVAHAQGAPPAALPGPAAQALGQTEAVPSAASARPNVLLIMTDDQGYGDMGCHGNPVIKTPNIDRLYHQSVRLTNFHVDPTCSPTRSALLTGRYSCRTGVWHTIMGRSFLRSDEVTVADLFAGAGYRTGIFGKWHLGDNYPYRAMDRGFHESLVHGGGGIGHAPDHWGNTYFSPVLCHNGRWEKTEGYCTDVFFAAATRFIEDCHRRGQPFFCYLPTNAPHGPYQVAEKYSRPYLEAGVPDSLARFYGMITNFDENLGRLLERLDQLGISRNTVVVYLTDNGTPGGGFNVEMRGRKGSVYEGGHRVPCFIRWPGRLSSDYDVTQLTAHIDILPTLLDFCRIPAPKDRKLDGRSLVPLLVKVENWAPRTLFVQSHRIELPQMWRNSAVMTERYRLIDGKELYDIIDDPSQTRNLAAEKPDVVDRLRFAYEEWYKDVSKRFDQYCPISLGAPEQNPTLLTSHDWHGHGADLSWYQGQLLRRPVSNGFWAVKVERAGPYRFTLRERPAEADFALPPGVARLQIGDLTQTRAIPAGAKAVSFELDLKPKETRLQTWLIEQGPGGRPVSRGAYYVEVEYLGTDAAK